LKEKLLRANRSAKLGLEFLERGLAGGGGSVVDKLISATKVNPNSNKNQKGGGAGRGSSKSSSGSARVVNLPGNMAKVRNFPRLKVGMGGWRRVGPITEVVCEVQVFCMMLVSFESGMGGICLLENSFAGSTPCVDMKRGSCFIFFPWSDC
jgi:hypothetical protein